MSVFTKYLTLDGVATTPVGEILKDMDEIGAGQIALTVRDRDERTVGGLIVLRGPDAERYMRAIEAVEKEIEAEEDAVSNPFANADGVGTVDVAGCQVVGGMIGMKSGGIWPEGGWVTDPGAGVTCLSYQPRPMERLSRQRLRQAMRQAVPMCGGCAAQKGSEASVSLHTRRDFSAAVKSRALFVCHAEGQKGRPCGGWCRAVQGGGK